MSDFTGMRDECFEINREFVWLASKLDFYARVVAWVRGAAWLAAIALCFAFNNRLPQWLWNSSIGVTAACWVAMLQLNWRVYCLQCRAKRMYERIDELTTKMQKGV